jgi:ABC-2 type transport system permease protein
VVARVLRLRLALLAGAFRGPRPHAVRAWLGAAALAATVVAAGAMLLTLRSASDDAARVVTVLGGAALTASYLLAPLITGVEDQLDPRRFAIFGPDIRPLTVSTALAGLVSVPVLATAVLGGCVVAVWAAHGVPIVVGVVAMVVAVATCSLLARVAMATAALVLRDRRSRELSGAFAILVIVVAVPASIFFASLEWGGRVPTQLSEAATVVGHTPLGAAWAIPALAPTGGADLVWAIVVAAATLAALSIGWLWLVAHMVSTPERPAATREHAGLGWFAVAPGTPGGAIAARSLVYWLRDRRYVANIVVVPVAAALAIIPPLIAGAPIEAAVLVPLPILALFFGWLPHDDLAYDSTALWLHIASGVRGTADRIGRLVPVLVVGVPVLAIAIPVAIAIHGRWAALPAAVGACAALFLSGLGLSSIASVISPYAVSRPGDSPFRQPQRSGPSAGAAQALVLLGSLVVSAPALWWAWLTVTGRVEFSAAALWGGVVIGVVVLVGGVAVGASAYDRRTGRLMEFAESA